MCIYHHRFIRLHAGKSVPSIPADGRSAPPSATHSWATWWIRWSMVVPRLKTKNPRKQDQVSDRETCSHRQTMRQKMSPTVSRIRSFSSTPTDSAAVHTRPLGLPTQPSNLVNNDQVPDSASDGEGNEEVDNRGGIYNPPKLP